MAHEAFEKQQLDEDSEAEVKKPAFFQRDEQLGAAKKELEKERGDDEESMKEIEPWRLEEYEAYKKLEKEMEVDFSDKGTVEDHEKMLQFFKIPKDK